MIGLALLAVLVFIGFLCTVSEAKLTPERARNPLPPREIP